jgi:hypothetical protein
MKRVVFARTAALAVLVALLPSGHLVKAYGQQVQLRETHPTDAGTITGRVVNPDNTPVPHARLHLRDVTAGQIVQTTDGNDAGQFTFVKVPPGSYVVEVVDRRERVLALGQMLPLGPRDTVTTLIRLAASSSSHSGLFGNAALAVLAAAATLGLTALGNGGQPASGRS